MDRNRHLRIVRPAAVEPIDTLKIQYQILGELGAMAAQLVAERLAPIDPTEARILLSEIREGTPLVCPRVVGRMQRGLAIGPEIL